MFLCHLMKGEMERRFEHIAVSGGTNRAARATPHQTGRGVCVFTTTSLKGGFFHGGPARRAVVYRPRSLTVRVGLLRFPFISSVGRRVPYDYAFIRGWHCTWVSRRCACINNFTFCFRVMSVKFLFSFIYLVPISCLPTTPPLPKKAVFS